MTTLLDTGFSFGAPVRLRMNLAHRLRKRSAVSYSHKVPSPRPSSGSREKRLHHQSFSNRSGLVAVYRTVCLMFRSPRQC